MEDQMLISLIAVFCGLSLALFISLCFVLKDSSCLKFDKDIIWSELQQTKLKLQKSECVIARLRTENTKMSALLEKHIRYMGMERAVRQDIFGPDEDSKG